MNDRLLITMGDVAGIGPEIIAKGWAGLVGIGRSIVVGDPGWLQRAVGTTAEVQVIRQPGQADPTPTKIPCLRIATADVRVVASGHLHRYRARTAPQGWTEVWAPSTAFVGDDWGDGSELAPGWAEHQLHADMTHTVRRRDV